MFNKYLDPKNDFAFKRIFGSEKNKDILIALLNDVLQHQLKSPIQTVTFLSPIQEPEVLAQKQSIVDVLCQDQTGSRYIIEMQVANYAGFQERAQYYACKAFISQMKAGEPYQGLDKVIFLAFTNFDVFPGKAAYKSEHVVLDKKTYEHNLDKLSFTFIDLPKFDRAMQQRKAKVEDLSLEEKFYYFLYHAPVTTAEEFSRIIKNSPIIEKAYKELNSVYWSDEDIFRYEQAEKRFKDYVATMSYQRQEGIKEGIKEGRKEGRKEGIDQGRADTIKGMFEAGVALELIAKGTKLPVKEVKRIVEEKS